MKIKVFCYPNGSTAVSDGLRGQLPELQEPWILLLAEFLKSKGVNLKDVVFETSAGVFEVFESSNGLNWRRMEVKG